MCFLERRSYNYFLATCTTFCSELFSSIIMSYLTHCPKCLFLMSTAPDMASVSIGRFVACLKVWEEQRRSIDVSWWLLATQIWTGCCHWTSNAFIQRSDKCSFRSGIREADNTRNQDAHVRVGRCPENVVKRREARQETSIAATVVKGGCQVFAGHAESW